MRGAYTAAQIRTAETALMAAQPEGTLMRRAAFAVATQAADLLGRVYGSTVVLLVGTGNNGGDALYAGAVLAGQGASVLAVLVDPATAHPAGVAEFVRTGGRVVGPDAIERADLIIDGLLGIGGRPGLRGAAAEWAQRCRSILTVAVDVPSGVDADTGADGGAAIRADRTVTFGGLKPGLICGSGAELAGQVVVADIGLGAPLGPSVINVLERLDAATALIHPDATSDKYTRGVVGVLAGSAAYPGAGVLATGSARLGGAGLVRYLGLAVDEVRARYPDVIVHKGARPGEVRVQSWTIGPGLGTGGEALGLLREVLATDVPVIVDADAITLLARHPDLASDRRAATIITPHDREFERLAGPVGDDRIDAARGAAAKFGITVLLKGNATVVADPDGTVWINPTGTPWLATAGSGDVLSGLIGSLLATGLAPGRAAAVGAYIHGVAGQLAAAGGPPTSADVLDAVRPALARVADAPILRQ
jgi:ADP-dependent NAD(P)H-hydrate dehydratase / NAD(P)H-hydrate epimerase